jgi:hypothetical protein
VGGRNLAGEFYNWRTFTMITTLVIIAAIIGAILGLRFKVSILAPVFLISSAAIFGTGIAHGEKPLSNLLAAFLATSTLQLGYLAGAFIQLVVTKIRARKGPSNIIAIPQRR